MEERQRGQFGLIVSPLLSVALVVVVGALRSGRSLAQVAGMVALLLVAGAVVWLIYWEATTPEDPPGAGRP